MACSATDAEIVIPSQYKVPVEWSNLDVAGDDAFVPAPIEAAS